MSETVFKKVDYDLSSLMNFIELGNIALPDIQRPFVWKNAKIRDLFDSMYRGYPVGYLLFWQNATGERVKSIGTNEKQKVPDLLIVDGQQRLTSLYAIIKGIPVVRENYEKEKIEVAFNPLSEKFEVTDAAIQRDKAYISDISKLWNKGTNLFEVADEYLSDLEGVREVEPTEKKKIREALAKLHSLLSFPLTALELSANIDEEQVAEVFVRINSKGKSLNQADFILTLMSVFWDEGRTQLENFCRDARTPAVGVASPFNYYFREPSPDQLLRVAVGVGFKRARLKYAYSILRGKDLETGEFSEDRRIQQFKILQEAQSRVLNLQYWHDFFKAILLAGYRSESMIGSGNNLLFSYILYLIGRTEYHVEEYVLRKTISHWFYMTSLTGRYSSSPESKMEFDLARFREIKTGDEFVKVLERVCHETLTGDFWTITLPMELATSSPTSPSLFAYYAALNLLEAKVLFSKQRVVDMLDPANVAQRSAVERHHLFPKAYLKTLKITEIRDTNQIANYALVEWGDNGSIGDNPPKKYLPALKQRFSEKELEKMYNWHALPPDWENLEYGEFLRKRRELIAQVILDGYKRLTEGQIEDHETGHKLSIEDMITSGENISIEFKSTLRMNLHTDQKDPRMELSCLKTIAGFLNHSGGTLIIGVADDGEAIGIEADKFENEDKMCLHLVNLIKAHIGIQHMMYIHPRFENYDDKRTLVVECSKSKSPVYLKDNDNERFYIRTGASTSELSPSQAHGFIKGRFP